ncbi:MAG TPA: aminotransferase class I/II-fold pyridoxal phosphate-dependent enzyme [Solirubrobacteraceae bacterium]|nr:aminotransferase class I/II-fold pyridoxal phosphate-dependent enzyme [Solirubrobacteraceae bacterium]
MPVRQLLPTAIAERLRARSASLAGLGTLQDTAAADQDAYRQVLDRLAARLTDTYPYGSVQYIGQMLKPPHPIAWAAYATTMLLNPNNHALDGGPATAAMEREAVAQLAAMFGYDPASSLGHLTSSGTIANLEALWVARELRPDGKVLYGANAHYTHQRMCGLLGVPHESIAEDASGRMDLESLERALAGGGVGTVVATLGTTGLGALDGIDQIAALTDRYCARLHVDAAYGGFFTLLAGAPQTGIPAAPFEALRRADSIVIDPHKHGLQPYGCGCVLFADPAVGSLYKHDSPYTYFTSEDLHLGEISIECSRAGAAAAALWATLQLLPLTPDGLGAHVAGARAAALEVSRLLAADPGLALVVEPQLDIVCPFARVERASEITRSSERAFEQLAQLGWHAAKLRVDTQWLRRRHPWIEADADSVTTLRCVLMKPEQRDSAGQIAAVLSEHLAGRRSGATRP